MRHWTSDFAEALGWVVISILFLVGFIMVIYFTLSGVVGDTIW